MGIGGSAGGTAIGGRHGSRLSANARGSLYMVVGSLGYVINDALIRLATEEGLDVYQALCLRALAMTVMFAAGSQVRGERISRAQFQRPLVIRVLAELAGTAAFFAAIVRLEFANAQTLLLIVPFLVTLAARVFLNEKVTGWHYVAVAAGFIGVVMVVQPATDEFSGWSLAVLAAAGFLTVREFATRSVPAAIPASTVALVTAAALAVLMGVISLFSGWSEVTAKAALQLGGACVMLTIGYLFTIQTVRVGELSATAPFRYTTMLGAVVLGLLLFDEVPNGFTIAGCVVIVVAGLVAIRIEHQDSAVIPVEPK